MEFKKGDLIEFINENGLPSGRDPSGIELEEATVSEKTVITKDGNSRLETAYRREFGEGSLFLRADSPEFETVYVYELEIDPGYSYLNVVGKFGEFFDNEGKEITAYLRTAPEEEKEKAYAKVKAKAAS